MIEAWLPVIFGVVIVVGMVTARVWTTLLSEGLPLLRDWVVGEDLALHRGHGGQGELPSRAELARRVEELEDELRFVESLLEGREGASPREPPGSRGTRGPSGG